MNGLKPSLLDRAIGYVSPGWFAARQQVRLESSYREGLGTRLSEVYTKSNSTSFGSSTDRQRTGSMRDRARNAYRDNPVARTLIEAEMDNVVSDGFNLNATTKDEGFNREAEERWYEWLERADIRGLRSGCELQRLIWRTARIDGDAAVVLVDDNGASRLQIVPGDKIKNKRGTSDGRQRDGSYIVSGIEFTPSLQPRAFYIEVEDGYGQIDSTRVAANDVRFLAHLREPNQIRGESAFNTVFELLNQLSQYVDGVALAAWMATVFGLIYKDANSAKQVQGLPLLTNSQGNPQRALTLENGMVKYMAPEGEVVQVDAKQPLQQTPAFIQSMLRLIGMPFRMPLEVIAQDLSTANFASARIGLLGFYRHCRSRQSWFVSRFLTPTYQWWLSRERKRQLLGEGGAFKSSFPEMFWDHSFSGNAWDYTDPVSEVQSDLLQIDMGIKSPEMVMIERGRNPRMVGEQLKKLRPDVRSSMTREPMAQAATPSAVEKMAEFKQKVWLGFQADGTVADVAANLTDIKELTRDVGLPVNEEYIDPYLPVVADPGPLVTGDTIKDPEGDIVGGDVQPPAPTPADPAGSGATPPADPAAPAEPKPQPAK